MVYEVPASKASIRQNKFEFKIGGKSYTVPKFAYLPVSVAEILENTPDDAVGPYLDIFGTKDTPVGKAVRTLDKDQLVGLIQAWQGDSDVTAGESEAS
jgi:hypothetical protein